MSEQENFQTVERLWRAFDALDFDAAGQLLHDDFVEIWPQSGERVQGRGNFIAINELYPEKWHVTIMRVLACGDQVVSEVKLASGDELVFATSFFEFRDGKIIKETDYWSEPYDPPHWRSPWVEIG